MRLLAYLWILNVVLLVDWAKNRRPAFWLFALILLGPLGGLAYTVYFYEEITFPFPIASTLRRLIGKQAVHRCPRCGRTAPLIAHMDGRQQHFMCSRCVEQTFLEPHRAWEAVEAARQILNDSPKLEE